MDSMIYKIQTEDFYTDIAPDVDELFDTSSNRCTKGVKLYVTQEMTRADFECCLLEGEQIYRDQLLFRMTGQVITTQRQSKLALSKSMTSV